MPQRDVDGHAAASGAAEWCITMGLAPGAKLLSGAGVPCAVRIAEREIAFGALPPDLARALSRLGEGTDADALDELAMDGGGAIALAEWTAVRHLMELSGAVVYTLVAHGTPRATFRPCSPGDACTLGAVDGVTRLSRFAFARRIAGATVLDAPCARGPVTIVDHTVAATLLSADLGPTEAGGSYTVGWHAGLAALLAAANLTVAVAGDGSTVEDHHPALRSWEFADLLVHMRSRPTRHDVVTGGTNPWRGILEPLPVHKATGAAGCIPLARPSEPTPVSHDVVVGARTSRREHGPTPIEARALGHFLYRAARDEPRRAGVVDPGYPVTHRIYPSGGACYPLEIYPVIRTCEGLERGLYRYRPAEHALEPLAVPVAQVNALSEQYAWIMAPGQLPQVLLIITARFLRTSWKYQGVAYAVILKDVGVLYESMYLAASAGGLAACAGGTGIGPMFSKLIGVDPLVESPVGEFIVGA